MVLTRPLDRHLDGDELDALVLSQASGVSVVGRLSEEVLREAQRHVESCQDCDRKVQMHRSAQNAISLRALSCQAANGPDCSDEPEWVRVAAGLIEESEAKKRMNHAARCGHCGPLLKAAVTSLSTETRPDEEAALAKLDSARPNWQAQMARRLRNEGEPQRSRGSARSFWKSLFYWPRPVYATAVLAILVTAGWIGMRTLRTSGEATLSPSPPVGTRNASTPESVEQMLAQAYTENRTIDVRIAGAQHAPLRVERNERDDHASSFDRPQSLRTAVDIIGANLQKLPEDPEWLHAKGQAQMLEGAYDEAIETLNRAEALKPASVPILIDLGSAYYLRASRSPKNKGDYGPAINWLTDALSKDPDNPIALFNRALACETLCPNKAVMDWENYLRVDGQGDWAGEARTKLADLKGKLKVHEQNITAPLVTPSQIAANAADADLNDEIDNRIEEYLHIAITTWLPEAFPASSTPSSREVANALVRLSQLLEARHSDAWLTDVLNQPRGEKFLEGIQTLSSALRADDSGDYSAAQQSAHRAAEMLNEAHNSAAALRALAEEVYADDLLHDGSACLTLLPKVQPHLKHYPWLSAQMSLERSDCSDLVGNLGKYESEIQKGKDSARRHGFNGLYLRALGFEAQSKASSSDRTDLDIAFTDVSEGLSRFWSQHVDPMKGYNFYTDLDTVGDTLHLPYFQIVIWSEATAIIDRHPDILQRAMAHRWYANAAYLADMPILAEEQFEKAASLLAQAPQTTATIRDYLDAEVWLAELEVRKGDVNRASSRLEKVEPLLANSPSFVPEIRFTVARAEIAMKQGDSVAAEKALAPAIYLAEWALSSFPAERDRGLWAEEAQGAYRNLVEWKLRQGDAATALELWEWFKGAEVRTDTRSLQFPDVDLAHVTVPDFREAIFPSSPTVVHDRLVSLHEETVLTYAIFPDGLAVWVFDDRGIVSRWIAGQEQPLKEQADRFLRLCSSPRTDVAAIRLAGRSLYDSLLAPVASELDPTRTLIIEPDRYLNDIPWEALVNPNGRYLVAEAPIVVSSGTYRMIRLREPTPINTDTPALVVSVSSVPGLLSLPDVDREAQEVAKRFKYARWLQGPNANRSAIEHEIGNVGVFHFAGHAISSPLGVGLALATKDFGGNGLQVLGVKELIAGNLDRLDLAVLSACRTGADDQLEGVVSDDLARALLDQEVPHIVASRWNVDSAQTAIFMREFYDRLFNGKNVASSVQDARLAIASRAASVHPYYWAAFELQGTR